MKQIQISMFILVLHNSPVAIQWGVEIQKKGETTT